jgi:acetoin utilization deacetylase AcuC-like enzyme
MAPLGAVLEGGYDPPSLAASVLATVAALDGAGEAESIAAEQIVTPRLASAVGQFWEL